MSESEAQRSRRVARLHCGPHAVGAGAMLLLFPLGPAAAQERGAPPQDPDVVTAPAEPQYLDERARALHAAAVRFHQTQVGRLRAYEGTVRERMAVTLRTPLKDRTLYRVESARRVWWRRDGPVTIEVLALREQTPAGVEEEEGDYGAVDHFYDPARDRLLFGERRRIRAEDRGPTGSRTEPPVEERREEEDGERDGEGKEQEPDDFRIEHPLEDATAGAYVFASGDSIALALPDGRRLRAIELVTSPRVRASDRIAGSLWVEPETGALVRATYRLSEAIDAVRDIDDLREEDERGEFRWIPGLFKPWIFEVTVITVDYAVWEDDVWLPRRWRAEGVVSAGILKVPGVFDRSYAFDRVGTDPADASQDPDVWTGADPDGPDVGLVRLDRRRNGQDVRILVPEDPSVLRNSPELPPPVGEDAPGFLGAEEVDGLVRALAQVPIGAAGGTPRWFRWGAQRPDLLRFNRVEELSVGARGAILTEVGGHPISLVATLRLGTGDRHLNARLAATRASLRRTLTLALFHELAATEERGRHLGFGNAATALLAGRDDGDYYRRSGAEVAWAPPTQRRPAYRIAVSSEYHEPADVRTRFSLARAWEGDDWGFRPNVAAEEGWEHALELSLTPSWGSDPDRTQVGLDFTTRGSLGDLKHASASLSGRLVVPLPADLRLGLGLGGGIATDDVPAQRAFAVGGPTSLRGWDPRARVGPCAAQARADVQRTFSFGGVSVFTDAGWAGPCGGLRGASVLRSAGLGLSLIDGLIRADFAWGLNGGHSSRFDVYLDGWL